MLPAFFSGTAPIATSDSIIFVLGDFNVSLVVRPMKNGDSGGSS
jgi:hypothetical protein